MARRVNTQFLIVFSVIVVGGVLAAFIVAGPGKYWFRANPSKQFIAEGDALATAALQAPTLAERREKLDAAVHHFQQAIAADPRNPDIYVRIGDVLSTLAPYDPNTFIGQSRGSWEKALEINPDHLPALRRLLDSYYRELQLGGQQAGLLSRLRERAGQVHKLDPNDARAEALTYIPVLAQWAVANIETSDADVDAAINGLTPLIAKQADGPERADMVFYVARARAKRGVDAKRSGQGAAGDEQLTAATRTFDDALKGHESDGNLHLRYFDLLQWLNEHARSPQQKYAERMLEQAEAAIKFADADKDASQFAARTWRGCTRRWCSGIRSGRTRSPRRCTRRGRTTRRRGWRSPASGG
jgi:tetratricopeptide (TPR) repeat protein